LTRPPQKILIATFGSLGDLHPFVALAHALKCEGLAPVIVTSAGYRDFVEGEGIAFAPARPDVGDLTARLGLDMAGIARAMAKDDRFLFESLIFPHLRESYEDALAQCDGAAALVAHSLCFAAKIAAEKRGLPLVNVLLSPVLLYSAHDPPLGTYVPFASTPRSALALAYNRLLLGALTRAIGVWAAPVRRLRREAGLPKARGLELFAGAPKPAATIGLFSPLLAPPRPDHPDGTLIAGHSFHDRYSPEGGAADGDALAPDLAAFLDGGPAPIVFTLGSFVARDRPAHYRACAEAARKLGRRAVLLAHDGDLEALGGVAGPDVFVSGYAPHSLVFPRACLIAHHGGIGTTGQALRAGRPQLTTPFLGDQYDNGDRLRRLGVARTLRRQAATPERLARELEALLSTPAYAARAEALGREAAREDGAAAAAQRIAALVRGRPATPASRAPGAGGPSSRPADSGSLAFRERPQ